VWNLRGDRSRGARRAAVAAALLICVAGAATARAQRPAEERELRMVVGEQTMIPAQNIAKFLNPTEDVVELRETEDGKELFVVALRPGETTFLIVMRDGSEVRYTVIVLPRPARIEVKPRANIRLDFYFVQLTDRGTYQVGIGWPGSVGGNTQVSIASDLRAGRLTSATASVAIQVVPRIDLLQERGWARLLRQATIIMANGEEGSFKSGGEINVLLNGDLQSQLQQIEFGSGIVVRPIYDAKSGRIEVQITADVSELTEPSSGNMPGRTVSKLRTLVNLEMGQSIVLAGLTAQSEANAKAGLPLLSQIPVVGALFGSFAHRDEHTENLLFIVPSVVDTVESQKRDLVREAYDRYEAFEGSFSGKLADPPRRKRGRGK
jgi:hypothetical protein